MKMTSNNPATVDYSDCFTAKDSLGRLWSMKKAVVKADYVQFLMKEDGLSEEEATTMLDSTDWEFWWHEQWVPYADMIVEHGKLVYDLSSEEKDRILNRMCSFL